MSVALLWALGRPLAYLWGSIPWGLAVGRGLRGIDVREYGSGAMGMANVLRILGLRASLLVLALDVGKGAAAALAASGLGRDLGLGKETTAALMAGYALACLVGHIWPVLAGFRGGRGTAPGLGALLVLSPPAGLVAILLGVPALFISRYVSAGSLVGAAGGGLTALALAVMVVHPLAVGVYGALGMGLVVVGHLANIQRLLRGEERRIGGRGWGSPEKRRWPRRRPLAGQRREG